MTSPLQLQRDYEAQYGGPEVFNYGNAPLVVNPDFKRRLMHRYTLVGATLIGAPLAPPPFGVHVIIQLVQDATGGRVVTWSTDWRDAPNWSAGGAAAAATALAEFVWDGQAFQYTGGSDSGFSIDKTTLQTLTGSVSYLADAPRAVVNPQPTAGGLTLAGVAPGFQRNTIVARGPLVGTITFAGVAFNIPVKIIVPEAGAIAQVPSLALTGAAPKVTQP